MFEHSAKNTLICRWAYVAFNHVLIGFNENEIDLHLPEQQKQQQ